jgi:hypothetical protein
MLSIVDSICRSTMPTIPPVCWIPPPSSLPEGNQLPSEYQQPQVTKPGGVQIVKAGLMWDDDKYVFETAYTKSESLRFADKPCLHNVFNPRATKGRVGANT